MALTWTDFKLEDALAGKLVGKQPDPGTTVNDLSKVAGRMTKDDYYNGYKVVINGKTARIDTDGKVIASSPDGAFVVGTQMKIANDTITETVGEKVTRGLPPVSGHTNNVTLTSMEPRDYFAISILNAFIARVEDPVSFDDANVLMYTRAAYRWAYGMMIAAANSREGDLNGESEETEPVDVNPNTFTSNTEKLLYNIQVALENQKAQDKSQYDNSHTGGSLKVKVTNTEDSPVPTKEVTEEEEVVEE